MTLSLDSPRTPFAKLLAFVEARAPQRIAPIVAQARRDVAVVEGRLLLGTRPNPLIYDQPSSHGRSNTPVDADAKAPARAEAPAVAAAPTPAAAPAQAKAFDASVVTIVDERAGTHVVPVAKTQFLLEAALTSGVNIPFSCTLGGCGTCKVKLLEGEMELEEPNCLTPAELDAGFRLSCVGRVVSPTCRLEIVHEE